MDVTMSPSMSILDYQQAHTNSPSATNTHQLVKPIVESSKTTIHAIDHNKNLHAQMKRTAEKAKQALTPEENRKDELQKLKERLNEKIEELVKQIKNLSKFDSEATKQLKESFQSQLIQVQGQLTKVIDEERKLLEKEARKQGL
ncbi:hypothetical protein AB733_20760 [Photobacterium swingsii]|uniref:Uncharacterized protein n=1 Tax=Photobacterium swingsii TaxID=680026 RepID=A0A0J8V8B3_9GAMM|nr:hypothetical protein [Photobacterium swingsii]KMV28895.1 hypothetical protein AB733_20760 [Photobacterium swingsii]PSW24665.1 hypothetical protein C9I94_11600 [Photobacterium swingsii]